MCVCVCVCVLLSHKKKKWNFAICSNLEGFGMDYAKWNKLDRERQIFYTESKKHDKLVNITKKKVTHRYRELVVTRGERSGEGQ